MADGDTTTASSAGRRDGFVVPTKAIRSQEDVQLFQKSAAFKTMNTFILALNKSVKGRSVSSIKGASAAVEQVVAMLRELGEWVDEIPPIEQPMRYGNKAYRTWHERLQERAPSLVSKLLPDNLQAACVEITPYLVGSFGDWQRIDYGTGHEHAFICFLICLSEIEVLTSTDTAALVTRVFVQYLDTCRKLQLSYKLEPAGSHGVWSLDDYQFMPFLLGSAQLVDHPMLKPASIHDPATLGQNADEYLYFAAVKFACTVKTGMLAEHSPMLNDISGVVSWSKINQGMLKMYTAEVLTKFPVCQHFFFGSLIPPPSQQA